MVESKRYSGRSLEEAIGKATEALGSGAEVLEAKRVRRGGLLGVMKSETYEVSARARPQARPALQPAAGRPERERVESAGGSFENELRSMIDEVDLREDRQLLRQRPATSGASSNAAAGTPTHRAVTTASRPRVANRFTDDDLAPLPPAPPRTIAQTAARAVAPAPARAATQRAATARAATPAAQQLARSLTPPAMRDAGAALPPPPGGDAGRPGTIDLREELANGPQWSSHALRELGVPEAVLELMPTAALESDIEWTVALEAAIRARVPLTPTVPLAVHGYGDNAAVKMLESTLNGYAMGDLHLLDRVVPATPFEITLAIRACLSR